MPKLGRTPVRAHPPAAAPQRSIPRCLKDLILLRLLILLTLQRKRPPIIGNAYRNSPRCLKYDSTNWSNATRVLVNRYVIPRRVQWSFSSLQYACKFAL